jgi:hydroxymethylglutaryl-CoA synthase
MQVGIESLSFYIPHLFIDLKTIAEKKNAPAKVFYRGIGQEKMAVTPPDEDIISMGANAAWQACRTVDTAKIDTLFFATESGVDQSKAAGIYVHRLLQLSPNCRTVELKQACYSGTAALQMAIGWIRQHPDSKALIVMSDIARYGLSSAGEPTQGAGSVAMVISAEAKILYLEPFFGLYCEDVMDFWRPNYLDYALVDGKYSISVYIKALQNCWNQYKQQSGYSFLDFTRFCYHLPFSKMAEKAHHELAKLENIDSPVAELDKKVEKGLLYNRIIGNIYTASLYMGLISMLENSEEELSDERLAFFSYGSGCVAEFFSGMVLRNYQSNLPIARHRDLLKNRIELTYQQYAEYYNFSLPTDGSTLLLDRLSRGKFRLKGIRNHMRLYE